MMKINLRRYQLIQMHSVATNYCRKNYLPCLLLYKEILRKEKLDGKEYELQFENERWKTLCKHSKLTGRRHSTKCIEVKCFLFTEQLNFSINLTYTRRQYNFSHLISLLSVSILFFHLGLSLSNCSVIFRLTD